MVFKLCSPQDGTALPTAGISGTDPEGTAVTYSIDCGTDSGYLTIGGSTGIVTMATSYDLETAGVDSYTIKCVVTATDATGEKSTATLNVVIGDGNDEAPVFELGSYAFFIEEGILNLYKQVSLQRNCINCV